MFQHIQIHGLTSLLVFNAP